MGAETSTDASFPRDFFVSYTGVDEQWAEWIAWNLEVAGYQLFCRYGISVQARILLAKCTASLRLPAGLLLSYLTPI